MHINAEAAWMHVLRKCTRRGRHMEGPDIGNDRYRREKRIGGRGGIGLREGEWQKGGRRNVNDDGKW
jgi:hypothetical protein